MAGKADAAAMNEASTPPRGPARFGERSAPVLFGLALLLLPEGLLRLAGYGGAPPLLLALSAEPTGPAAPFREVNPTVAEPFFARSAESGTVLGGHRREVVPVPKPPEELRIVLAGASTVEGFPLPGNVTAARFLEAGLQSLLPGRPVRVVNLGVTAVASYPVRELSTRALRELEPDLLVVYTGHNELFGAAGVASWQRMGSSVRTMRAVYALRRLALWQGLRDLLVPSRPAARGPELVEVMAGVEAVEPGGPQHERARRNLEINLRAIAAEARRRGVPAVFSTVASNLRDLAPIGSWEGDLPPKVAASAAAAHDAEPDELSRLAAAAPLHAGVAYALARALEGRDEAEAAALYARARDLDSMPWRAPAAVGELIRRVSTEERVGLADAEAAFAAAVDGPPGWDLFADHLHPNLEGQALLAATLLRAVAETGAVDGLSPAGAEGVAWPAVAHALGWNRLDAYLLTRKMAAFFRDAPLGRNNAAAVTRFEERAAALEAELDPAEQRAVAAWREASDAAGRFVPIAWFGGVAALEAGDAEGAAASFRAAGAAAGFADDERAAARLLEVLTLVRADPSAAGPRLAEARREAEIHAASAFPQTAVTLRSLAGLRALAGDAPGAREAEARAAALTDRLPPASRRYLAVLPEPERLLAARRPR